MIDVTRVSNGSGDERRAEARERRGDAREHRIAARERREPVEVELGPEQLPHDRLGLRVERLDADAARRGLDAHLAAVHDAVQAALVPEVRAVGAEYAVALRGQVEVVRLREPQQAHRHTVAVSTQQRRFQ